MLSTLRSWTPSQLAALGFGYWWTANAVGAILASDSSLSSPDLRSAVHIFGLTITVNGWHVLFHLITGLIGLAVCAYPTASRAYAFAMATLYATVSVWGLAAGSTAIGFVAVNTAGTIVHVIETFAMVGIALATKPTARNNSPAPAH